MAEMSNDLIDFVIAQTKKLADEYERVQRRVGEDPGTAGDQGEENWASLLRQWLPPEYRVITKGRILGHKGGASPQVDVVVLHPSYPPELVDKKLYLAAGVAAAFECKLTLTRDHIEKSIKTCAQIKKLTARRTGTPYLELNSPLLYGVLAHSHSWQAPASTPRENITRAIEEVNQSAAGHPREILDVLCVADLGSWVLRKHEYLPPRFLRPTACVMTAFLPYVQPNPELQHLSPIGALLLTLFQRLAWEDRRLRRMADFFSLVLSPRIGNAQAVPQMWDLDAVYTPKVKKLVEVLRGEQPVPENAYGTPGGLWNEWQLASDSLSDVKD